MSGSEQGGTLASVLLLSGRPAFLDPLSQAFSAAGLTVIVARDIAAAVAAFVGDRVPAGAIIDLLTITDEADEVCNRLRDAPAAASIPILFIGTGIESVRSTTDALIAGGDGFFQLPVEASRVMAKIAAYVGAPVPSLPQGLLVTVDEYDLLERTPEPVRIIVPPAALPSDLLGDDENDNSDDPFLRGDTPPSGLHRPPDSEEFSSDFSDTTSPMTRRTALTARPAADDTDDARRRSTPMPTAAPIAEAGASDDGPTALTALASLIAAETSPPANAPAGSANNDDGDDDGDDGDGDDDDDAVRAATGRLERARQERAAAAEITAHHRAERAERLAQRQAALVDLQRARDNEAHAIAALEDIERSEVRDEEVSVDAFQAVRLSTEADIERLAAERAQRVADQHARTAAVVAARDDAEADLTALRAAQAAAIEAEEAAIAHLAAERQKAEAELDALKEAEQALLQDAEQRMTSLSTQRHSAQDALARLTSERERRIAEEEHKLATLGAERQSTEQALATLEADQRRRVEDEEARLQELTQERIIAEQALAALQLEQQSRRKANDAELKRLSERRMAVELEQDQLDDDVQRRLAEQASELAALAERRGTLEAELEGAEAARESRLAEESAELEILASRRAAAAADDDDATVARDAKRRAEEGALAELQARRESLIAEVDAVAAASNARAEQEEERLAALAGKRAEAEAAIAQAEAALQQQQADEHARLDALQNERDARQSAIAQLAADEATRRERADAELEALASQRAALELALQALTSRRHDEEHLATARIAELEVARQRAEADVAQLTEQRRVREIAASEAIAAAEILHAEAVAAHEARCAVVVAAITVEEERLAAIESERAARQATAAEQDAERSAQLAAQEAHLTALAEQATLERARLAEEAAIAERALFDRERSAAIRLAELEAEQARLHEAAKVDAERLAHMRAEEEAARAALTDARARARMAFVGGRFDAVPDGSALAGRDVGSDPRADGEGEGIIYGGPLVDVGGTDHEPPPPPPFVALEPPEGRFDDGELPGLLLSAWSQHVTGAIEIRVDEQRWRTIFLEDGEPVFVASNQNADRPEEQLLKGGFITASLHSELRIGEAVSARRLCSRLVDDGALKLDELFAAVRGVLTEQLLRVCEWSTGTFRFIEDRAHASDRVRLEHHFDAVVAEGVRRKYDEARLWSVLGGPATLLGPADISRSPPPLSPEERLAIERFDGTRSLDDVVLGAGLHSHVVLRAALLGVASAAVRVLARGLPRAPGDVIARRERSVAIDRARIVDRLALARHGDYFTFLGVDVTATPFEIHRQASRLRERFDPARHSDAVFADLKAALREIVDVAADAEAVLADPGLKDAYRTNMATNAPPTLRSRAARSLA